MEQRKVIKFSIIILVIAIIVLFIVINIIKGQVTRFTIRNAAKDTIVNHLPYNDNIIYQKDNLTYSGAWISTDEIKQSKCNIKIYADGRVLGEGYYVQKDKKKQFEINGQISEEDTNELQHLVDIATEYKEELEISKVSEWPLDTPDFKGHEGENIIADNILRDGMVIKNGKEYALINKLDDRYEIKLNVRYKINNLLMNYEIVKEK